jgi:hypothetical protein
MASASTRRVIAYRQRQRLDQCRLTITVAREPLVSLLVAAKLLGEWDDNDNAKLAEALEKLLDATTETEVN